MHIRQRHSRVVCEFLNSKLKEELIGEANVNDAKVEQNKLNVKLEQNDTGCPAISCAIFVCLPIGEYSMDPYI